MEERYHNWESLSLKFRKGWEFESLSIQSTEACRKADAFKFWVWNEKGPGTCENPIDAECQ